MPKRFTATEKWEDPWFRSLKPAQKLLWLYVLDRCDLAGVLDLDLDLAEFCIGAKVNLGEFGDRIVKINGGTKVWVRRFIEFQYKCRLDDLDPAIPVHKKVLEIVKKYSLSTIDTHGGGTGVGIDTHKEEDKEEDKDKDRKKTKKGRPENLLEVGALFTERGYSPDEAERFWNYYESNGWVIGKARSPCRDWTAAAANWMKNKRDWGNNGTDHRTGGSRGGGGREIFTDAGNDRITRDVEAIKHSRSGRDCQNDPGGRTR